MKYTMKQARMLRGMRCADVAKELELSVSGYRLKENMVHEVTVREAAKFCKLVDIPFTDIIFSNDVTF